MAKIKVGDKFTIRSTGETLTVVDYQDSGCITVEDLYGNTKVTNSGSLRQGLVAIGDSKLRGWEAKFREEMGESFKLNCGVEVSIVEYNSGNDIVIQDAQGNRKSASACSIRSRAISWSEFGVRNRKPIPVGKRIKSEKHGFFTVLACDEDVFTTSVLWEDSGHIQHGDDLYETRYGRITDKSLPRITPKTPLWDTLKPTKNRSYVYVASFNDEVLYVGKGTGGRYAHTINGCSHVLELNRLFFAGESVSVSLYKDDLSSEEAIILEKQVIQMLSPKYNKHWATLH